MDFGDHRDGSGLSLFAVEHVDVALTVAAISSSVPLSAAEPKHFMKNTIAAVFSDAAILRAGLRLTNTPGSVGVPAVDDVHREIVSLTADELVRLVWEVYVDLRNGDGQLVSFTNFQLAAFARSAYPLS